MQNIMKYFKGSFLFTAIAIILCYMAAGIPGAIMAMILGVLETSLSVDNAVVNSKILKNMDEVWKRRFLTWGMLIAVFGMRIVFPILIVWATSSMGLIESVVLPFKDPVQYAATLTAAHISIAGFGGTFLLMVFLSFFLDGDKEEHWIPGFEHGLAWFSVKTNSIFVSLAVLTTFTAAIVYYASTHITNPVDVHTFLMTSMYGAVTYIGVQLFGELFEAPEAGVTIAKTGFAGFLYLEILDASFSFDGVIGAFAVTNNIIIIALGLGIGAMFVRSLTIMMVDKDTLGTFKYLEHGAFWSIGVLAACMFVGTFHHVSEIFTGLSAAAILALAMLHSIHENRKAARVTVTA